MRFSCCVLLFAVLVAVCVPASAPAGELSWAFQCTGFPVGDDQTAVAMRDGRVWPVIFTGGAGQTLDAYSLYPTMNPQTGTFWHQIGGDLLNYSQQGSVVSGPLSAATSPDGRIGVVVGSASAPSDRCAAVLGAPATGFGSPIYGVRSIDFDAEGNLIAGQDTILPPPYGPVPLVDLAVSPFGDRGMIDDNMYYWHEIGWAPGGWVGPVDLRQFGPQLIPDSMDLTFDSLGRPHVLGTNASTTDLISYDFDVRSGLWTFQVVASSPGGYLWEPAVAVDSQGRMGAAWVQDPGTGPVELKYAYQSAAGDWVSTTVASQVTDPLHGFQDYVIPQQIVGLSYDYNDFPVISFAAGTGTVWLAYDPPAPVSVPEPWSLVLLAMGVVGVGVVLLQRAGKCPRSRPNDA
ncbi:MAG: hypothetical protein JXB62_13320 [Pirellulales bacterium]|nr:hypothetical protein [Pirellulales bacterium]